MKDLNNYPMSRRQMCKNTFLLEIIENYLYSKDDCPKINEKSLIYAIKFMIKLPDGFNLPETDIHPDGEFSYVWYGKNKNILTIVFSENGLVSYAYLSKKDKEEIHGEFSIDGVSLSYKIFKLLIQKFD